jgi:two-component system response regulator YesN
MFILIGWKCCKARLSLQAFFVEDRLSLAKKFVIMSTGRATVSSFAVASDGEMALPLLQTVQPDVLITDIKMPFMDGLELCKIVRERMPWVKIVILSGHDEFEYAQQAINLGVTEYLLKPVTVQSLHEVLQKLAAELEQERKEQENLKRLEGQIEENRATLRERLLLKLVVGAVSATEAIGKGQLLGLDLIARCYLVVILKIELSDRSDQFDYAEYQQVQHLIADLVENNPDIFLLKKDWEELVLVMKGGTPEYLEEERDLLLGQIMQRVKETRYQLTIGVGTPQKRLADIYQSFVEALVSIQHAADANKTSSRQVVDRAELLKVDKSAAENYLRSGSREGFDQFFDAYLQPLGETALKSYLIKNYIFVDVVLATAKLVNELGGDIDQVIPELNSIETILTNIKTIEQLREQARKILVSALAFRDSQTKNQYTWIIRKAKEYIDHHYMDPDLSLNEVAAQVNLSPSHFSTVFSQETFQTFKEYLTEIRIKEAKELLRMTTLRSAEISYRVGYSDPHYFSSAFRKNTGLTPTEFRLQAQVG